MPTKTGGSTMDWESKKKQNINAGFGGEAKSAKFVVNSN